MHFFTEFTDVSMPQTMLASSKHKLSPYYAYTKLSQLTHFKLYIFWFQFRRDLEVFLECVNSATTE